MRTCNPARQGTPETDVSVTEIELKLAVRPPDLAKLKAALRATASQPEATSGLASTYYDTADHALKRRHLSLRVRKVGRRFVQTVKSYEGAGSDLVSSGEWEDPVIGTHPDLAAPTSGRR